MSKLRIAVIALGLALLALPSAAFATPSDGIFVTAPGGPPFHTTLDEAGELRGAVRGVPVPTGFGLIGTIELIEPTDGSVSDVFGYGIFGTQQVFFFISDPVSFGSFGELPPVTGMLTETGKRQNVTTLLFGDALPIPGLRFFVRSDLEGSPEPASMALFAIGLVGLIALRRRLVA